MSRSHPPLQQHLLTRSDLARLGVPAGDILAWLARGAIEQVGTLAGDGGDDPVFTAAPELRADLSTRLASIGKSAVVLSPLRVRSFLLRALMQRTVAGNKPPRASAGGAMTPAEALAEHLATTDLAQVLHEAAAELEADVEHVLRIAEEEARLEASIGVAAGENTAQHNELAGDSGSEASTDESHGATYDEHDDEAGEDEACFDVDDLATALGEWDEEPAAATSDAGDAQRDAVPEPESAAAPLAHDGEADEVPANAPAVEVLAAEVPTVEAPAVAATPGPALEPAGAASEAVPAAPHAVDDVADEEPQAAAALAAAPNREEPTMSAEPMATEHEDHPAAEQAASEAIAGAEQALEPLLHEQDQPPTFDAAEIAAALSVLDLDAGPAKPAKATAAATPAAAAASAPARQDELAHAVEAAAVAPQPAPPAHDEAAPREGTPAASEHAIEAAVAATAAASPTVAGPEAAAREPAPASTSAPANPPAATAPPAEPGDATPVLAASMQRVETFLGELKAALVEMAGRPVATPPPPTIQVPAAPPVDLAPLVGAIEGGLQKSAASSAAAATALTGLAEKLDGIGQRIERSAVAAESMAQHAQAPQTNAEPARFLVTRSNPVPLTLLAVAAMVTAWSVLFWFKTGSPRLALGTLIGANLVGCVLLTPGRFR